MASLANLMDMTWPSLTWFELALPKVALPSLSLPNLATLDLIAMAIILLGLCFWLVAKTSEARLKKTLQKASDASLYESQFRCVLFSASDHACKSALAYPTKPILIKDSPDLPLKGCNAEKCACSLLRYDDRRTGKDRRDMELLDKRRRSAYANKRMLKDRRRASIQEFLLPKYRSFS
jgi:hypothetical protein